MLQMVRELFSLLISFVCVSVSFGCPWPGENIEYFCLSLGLSLIDFPVFLCEGEFLLKVIAFWTPLGWCCFFWLCMVY